MAKKNHVSYKNSLEVRITRYSHFIYSGTNANENIVIPRTRFFCDLCSCEFLKPSRAAKVGAI